jgi:hypothetical protein
MIWTKLDHKTVSGQDVWQLVDSSKNVVTTAVPGHPELDAYIASIEATEPEAE